MQRFRLHNLAYCHFNKNTLFILVVSIRLYLVSQVLTQQQQLALCRYQPPRRVTVSCSTGSRTWAVRWWTPRVARWRSIVTWPSSTSSARGPCPSFCLCQQLQMDVWGITVRFKQALKSFYWKYPGLSQCFHNNWDAFSRFPALACLKLSKYL